MGTVHNFNSRGDNASIPPGGGSEPPMELTERVAKLEASMTALMTDVAVIRANYATREDLHKEISAQTWRLITYTTSMFVTVASALVAASYFIAKHVG